MYLSAPSRSRYSGTLGYLNAIPSPPYASSTLYSTWMPP